MKSRLGLILLENALNAERFLLKKNRAIITAVLPVVILCARIDIGNGLMLTNLPNNYALLPGLKSDGSQPVSLEEALQSVSNKPNSDVFSRITTQASAAQSILNPGYTFFSTPQLVDKARVNNYPPYSQYSGDILGIIGKDKSKNVMNPYEWFSQFLSTDHEAATNQEWRALKYLPSSNSNASEIIMNNQSLQKAINDGSAAFYRINPDNTYQKMVPSFNNWQFTATDVRNLGLKPVSSYDIKVKPKGIPENDFERKTLRELIVKIVENNPLMISGSVNSYSPISDILATPHNRVITAEDLQNIKKILNY